MLVHTYSSNKLWNKFNMFFGFYNIQMLHIHRTILLFTQALIHIYQEHSFYIVLAMDQDDSPPYMYQDQKVN